MSSLELFETVIDTVSLEPGKVLFRQGEPGDLMYLVKEGQIEIRVGERVLDEVGPGEIIGEMALIGNDPRSASAVAKTACRVLPVDEQRFLYLVRQTPYFSLHVMGVLAQRLRDRSHSLTD